MLKARAKMPNLEKQCFVIMPAGIKEEYRGGETESVKIFQRIKSGLESEQICGRQILVERETDKRESGAITRSILESLMHAEICIADLTGHNANVLLELGMRNCFRRGLTVMIAQDTSKIPFDIQPHRVISYSIRDPGKLIRDLKATIKIGLERNSKRSTSIVYDHFPEFQFTSSAPRIARQRGSASIMPLVEYYGRIDQVAKELIGLIQNGSYIPNVFIGLAKGGITIAGAVADRLTQIGHLIPVQTLFEMEKSFAMPKNNSMLEGLNTELRESSNGLNILLFDDHVASGECVKNAKTLIEKLIPGADVRFVPLISRNTKILLELFDQDILLWAHKAARRTKKQVVEMHRVYFDFFHDNKPIKQR